MTRPGRTARTGLATRTAGARKLFHGKDLKSQILPLPRSGKLQCSGMEVKNRIWGVYLTRGTSVPKNCLPNLIGRKCDSYYLRSCSLINRTILRSHWISAQPCVFPSPRHPSDRQYSACQSRRYAQIKCNIHSHAYSPKKKAAMCEPFSRKDLHAAASLSEHLDVNYFYRSSSLYRKPRNLPNKISRNF